MTKNNLPAANDSVRDPLFEALRSLPRETASPDFTSRVLTRLDDDRLPAPAPAPVSAPPHSAVWRLRWAMGAALVVVTLGGAGLFERQRERRELRGRVEALRQDHRAIALELEQLRTAGPSPSHVYLGGDDGTDYILELAPVAHGGPASPELSTQGGEV